MANDVLVVYLFTNKFFADENDPLDLSDEKLTEIFKECVSPSLIKPLYNELREEIQKRLQRKKED